MTIERLHHFMVSVGLKFVWFLAISIISFSCKGCSKNAGPSGEVLYPYNGLEGRVHRTRELRIQYWHEGNSYATRAPCVRIVVASVFLENRVTGGGK